MKNLLLAIVTLLFGIVNIFGQNTSFKPFKHYNERMAQFNRQSPIDSTDIVMLGNSLTEFGGDWNKLLNTRHIRNRGIAGDIAIGIYNRLDKILQGNPRAIFLLVGANDVSHNLTPQQVFSRCKKVIDKILTDAPEVKLYVQSLLPINESFGKWKLLQGKTNDFPQINKLLREYCEKKDITYIDLFSKFIRHGTNELRKELTSDGLHLSPIGYKVWAFEIKRYIDDELKNSQERERKGMNNKTNGSANKNIIEESGPHDAELTTKDKTKR